MMTVALVYNTTTFTRNRKMTIAEKLAAGRRAAAKRRSECSVPVNNAEAGREMRPIYDALSDTRKAATRAGL